MKDDVIIVRDLSRSFGNFKAVDSIAFSVGQGEIFGFLGANGAGKTTALKMLTGLLMPTSGFAEVAGYDVCLYPEMVKRRIGYMSQRFSLYEDLTVIENIRFFGGIYGISRNELNLKVDSIIESLGFGDQAKRLVGSLPVGWRQKIAFAVARVHNPRVIFLDEPTSGVDPITRRLFWDEIYSSSSQGVTIMVTTHYMEEAEYCNRVSIMVDGQLAAMDTPMKLKNRYGENTMDGVFRKLVRSKQVSD